MGRADTHHVTALLAATDDDDHSDQVTFEPQRLTLHYRHGCNIDPNGLAIAVRQSPLYRTSDRDRLIQMIDEHLDSAIE